jgi:hypothetical protein
MRILSAVVAAALLCVAAPGCNKSKTDKTTPASAQPPAAQPQYPPAQ